MASGKGLKALLAKLVPDPARGDDPAALGALLLVDERH